MAHLVHRARILPAAGHRILLDHAAVREEGRGRGHAAEPIAKAHVLSYRSGVPARAAVFGGGGLSCLGLPGAEHLPASQLAESNTVFGLITPCCWKSWEKRKDEGHRRAGVSPCYGDIEKWCSLVGALPHF